VNRVDHTFDNGHTSLVHKTHKLELGVLIDHSIKRIKKIRTLNSVLSENTNCIDVRVREVYLEPVAAEKYQLEQIG
jgi:hypothetical protein